MSDGRTAVAAVTAGDLRDGGTLWGAAERLRVVRRAHERFLALWAVDHLLGGVADGLSRDLSDRVPMADGLASDNPVAADNLGRALFRGGRLDD